MSSSWPLSKGKRVTLRDPSTLACAAVGENATVAVASELGPVSALWVCDPSAWREEFSSGLSRVTLAVVGVEPKNKGVSRPSAPPQFVFELRARVGGRATPVISGTWTPSTWSASEQLCHYQSRGIVEGWELWGRVDGADPNACETEMALRWLSDRLAGVPGASCGSSVVLEVLV